MDAPRTVIEDVAPGTIGLLSCLHMDDAPRLRRDLQERGFWWVEVRRPHRCDILYGPQSLGPGAFRLVDAALSPHTALPRVRGGHPSDPPLDDDRNPAPVVLRVQCPKFGQTALEWARKVAKEAGWSVLEAQSGVLWAEVMPLWQKSLDAVKKWLDQHNVAYEMLDNGSTWTQRPTALIPGKELRQEGVQEDVPQEAQVAPPPGKRKGSTTPRIDLRTKYDDKHLFRNGAVLYRRGNVFQIWYPAWGPETWTLPTEDEEETESCFADLVDQIEVEADERYLPEQTPATCSQCTYYASIKERPGWGRCSELDRDVPADNAVCAEFEPVKAEEGVDEIEQVVDRMMAEGP